MNENSAIINVNAAANRFCSRYRDLGNSLDSIGNEITNLQAVIDEKSKKYNITDKLTDFYNDDSITIESYYNSLGDSEKFKDDNGNIISDPNLLNDAERQALESQVKQMNAEQSDVKLDVVIMSAKIDKMEMDFEKTIIKFKNQLRLDYENFKNEQQYLSVLDRKLDNEIADCEYEIARIATNPAVGNANKTALIKDFRKQIAMANVKKMILNATSKVADVYHIAFESAYNSIDVNMYDDVDFIKKEDQIREELSIADKLQDLIDGFKIIKDNYSTELDKINAIELSIDEFKKHYENVGNANAFVQAALEATQSLRNTIDTIEQAKDIDKAKTDENGNVITPEPDRAQGNDTPDNNPQGPDTPDDDDTLGQNGPDNAPQGPATPDNAPQGPATPDNNPQGPDTPDNNSQGNDGPDNDGPDNDGPNNDGPDNNGPDNNGTLGQSGVTNDIAQIMKRAKRAKSARRWKAVKRTAVLGGAAALTFAAACGLGFVPAVASISATLFTATGVLAGASIGNLLVSEAINDLPAFAKYKATSFKLNRIAKKVTKQFNKHNKKSGIKFKVRTNPETGEIRFGIVNDGQDVGLIDSRSTGMVLGEDQSLNQAEAQKVVAMFQEQLDKAFPKFNSEKRGEYEDKFNLPPITVDNLPVLYTQFGGYNFNIEGEQFGMMDEVGYKKAKKEGKGIKNLFRKLRRKDKDDDLDDGLGNDLPGINPTQNDALDDAVNRPGVVGDGSNRGKDVDEDDLDSLLDQVKDDDEPVVTNNGNPSGNDDGDSGQDDANSQQQDPVQQDPVQQNTGDGLNASNLASVFEKIRNGFGLDDVEAESLLNDLNGLTDEQIAQLDSGLVNISDRNELISAIEQLKAPAADMGRNL